MKTKYPVPALLVAFALIPIYALANTDIYVDHRGHNVDSLEVAVADWTADRIAKASDKEMEHLVRDWHDLMLGYHNINIERSFFYGKKVFNASVQKDWKTMTWASAKVLGQYFWRKEQYDSAALYYNRALEAIEAMEIGAVDFEHPDGITQFDIDNGLSAMYGTIGNLYSIQDSVALAMDYYARAGEIFKKNGWKHALSTLHYNMAETWLYEGEILKAREDYTLGLSYAKEAGDSLWIASNKAGIGRVELEQGHLRKAIRLLDEANQYYTDHEDQEWKGLLENLDYTNQVLRLQKRQARTESYVLSVALILLIVSVVFISYARKQKKEKTQTEAVLDETIEDLTSSLKQPGIKLNDRELQILKLIAEGLPVKDIADKVCLSPDTVKWYRKKLLAKFDATSFVVVVGEAKKMGLL